MSKRQTADEELELMKAVAKELDATEDIMPLEAALCFKMLSALQWISELAVVRG